jgi:hypothetical protein
MPPKPYPRLLVAVLTGLNILNYVDRNVLFAVQSDVVLVKGVFRPRGGIGTTVEARRPRPKAKI